MDLLRAWKREFQMGSRISSCVQVLELSRQWRSGRRRQSKLMLRAARPSRPLFRQQRRLITNYFSRRDTPWNTVSDLQTLAVGCARLLCFPTPRGCSEFPPARLLRAGSGGRAAAGCVHRGAVREVREDVGSWAQLPRPACAPHPLRVQPQGGGSERAEPGPLCPAYSQ